MLKRVGFRIIHGGPTVGKTTMANALNEYSIPMLELAEGFELKPLLLDEMIIMEQYAATTDYVVPVASDTDWLLDACYPVRPAPTNAQAQETAVCALAGSLLADSAVGVVFTNLWVPEARIAFYLGYALGNDIRIKVGSSAYDNAFELIACDEFASDTSKEVYDKTI